MKKGDNTLGMPTSLMKNSVATTLPSPFTTSIAIVFVVTTMVDETPIIMTTLFIRQQIDLGIHDIMYQLFGQLVEIVKPMMQNEIQQPKELEVRKMNDRDNCVFLVPRSHELSNQVINIDSPRLTWLI